MAIWYYHLLNLETWEQNFSTHHRALLWSLVALTLVHLLFALLSFCEGNPPETGGFPSQRNRNAESVSMSSRHHVRPQEMGSELNVAAVMNPWLMQMGLPVLNLTQSGDEITATPTRFLANPDADASKPDSDYGWVRLSVLKFMDCLLLNALFYKL